MKKFLFVSVAFSFSLFLHSQDNPSSKTKKKDWSKVKLTNRANDHFMFQYGMTTWSKKPDSINTRGWSNSVNAYIMIDMPFKTDPDSVLHLVLALASIICSLKKPLLR
jgi:hypothetical protein